MDSNTCTVWVSYALPEQQWVVPITVARGAQVADVLALCKKYEPFMRLNLAEHTLGIFGKVVEQTQVVQPGDRVELYRTLIYDPKTARRKRAAATKPQKQRKIN